MCDEVGKIPLLDLKHLVHEASGAIHEALSAVISRNAGLGSEIVSPCLEPRINCFSQLDTYLIEYDSHKNG